MWMSVGDGTDINIYDVVDEIIDMVSDVCACVCDTMSTVQNA